jgi:hypothetical protein
VRSYGEPIEVRAASTSAVVSGSASAPEVAPEPMLEAAAPEQFLWRGRLYLVREVLAHWVELGAWWTGARSSRRSSVPASSPGVPDPSGQMRSVAVDVRAVEREVWRVEASAGRGATVGVYDLVRDVPATPTAVPVWRLARALD